VAPSPETEPSDLGGSPAPPGRVTLQGVTQRFTSDHGAETDALVGIDLDVEPGSFVTIVGPSGCGKSTLLRLVAGFVTPTEGQVTVDGRAVDGPGPDRGVVFQQPNLYPWLTVGNVAFGPRHRRVPRDERKRLVEEHLELVGLAEFARHRPYELSGGMQQRVQIARVLVNQPSIVLMDEPFGALDALTRDRLQEELLRIWRRTGSTILFVTHSVDEAVYLGTRVLVMSARPGRIVADVPAPFSSAPSPLSADDVRSSAEFTALRREVASLLH
jgi:taurine transport system ATP-binding protein